MIQRSFLCVFFGENSILMPQKFPGTFPKNTSTCIKKKRKQKKTMQFPTPFNAVLVVGETPRAATPSGTTPGSCDRWLHKAENGIFHSRVKCVFKLRNSLLLSGIIFVRYFEQTSFFFKVFLVVTSRL